VTKAGPLDVEEHLRALCEARDFRQAATRTIEAFGPEVLGFLVSFIRDESDASDVFAQACEDLWKGFPRFEGRSAVRTWFYALARHAAARFRRSPHRRPGRHVAISQVEAAAATVRTRTLPHLRTNVKNRFAAIRDALDPEDRALLVLRIDREMGWNDIARVLTPEETESELALSRVAARLRKRFQLVKEDIRERAKKAGLLNEGDDSSEDGTPRHPGDSRSHGRGRESS
jgi:RNA polymerase sigma-70 factor (ECF subfamily)